MSDFELMASQRNDILWAIQNVGFDPSAFEWKKVNRKHSQFEKAPKLVYRGSSFYFLFESSPPNHIAEFSPGADHPHERQVSGSWQGQIVCVHRWLEYLRREVEAPDLWGAVAQGAALLGGSTEPGSANTSLTASERAQIAASLNELKDYAVATYELTAEQTAGFEGKVDYLIEASNRLGRKDWINLAMGLLLSQAVSGALSTPQAQEFMRMAGQALHWLVQTLPLLSP